MPGRPGYVRNAMGVIWNRNGADKDIGVIDSPVLRDPENDTYALPPLDEARLRRDTEQRLQEKTDEFFYTGIGFSMFERAWSFCTMQEVLIGMLAYPARLEALLDEICEYNLKILDIQLQYNVDGVYFGDDWGQ